MLGGWQGMTDAALPPSLEESNAPAAYWRVALRKSCYRGVCCCGSFAVD
jgi:hypothetical protein